LTRPYRVQLYLLRLGIFRPERKEPGMSATATHQLTIDARAAVFVVAAAVVALALSIALPLSLHSTRTVFVHTPSASVGQTTPTTIDNPATLRAAHGG
jgi:hypothetical protein